MAEFLDKLKGKLDKGLTTVNTKSKELIERQKTKLHLSELEAERKMVFQDLGKLAYTYYQSSGKGDIDFSGSSAMHETEPLDRWDEAVLEVVGKISRGELSKSLFEDTAKQFKITAKTLYEEVEKLIPQSEKKGQNLQWLGRVLGKFELTAKKVSKRINGDRETVYVFDKKKTQAIIDSLTGGTAASAPQKETPTEPPDTKSLIAKCKKINELNSKISKLEEQLREIGEKV